MAGADDRAVLSVLAALMPRVVMPFAACTSARPLSNVRSCCSPSSSDWVPYPKPERPSGTPGVTVVGSVLWPTQNRLEPFTETTAGKVDGEFSAWTASAARPAQPVGLKLLVNEVCHWSC